MCCSYTPGVPLVSAFCILIMRSWQDMFIRKSIRVQYHLLSHRAEVSRSSNGSASEKTNKKAGLVQIKRLAGVQCPEDSCLVQGLVCRKNLTHRKMRRKIQNPRILILGNAFEFPSTQARLASFDQYTKDQACCMLIKRKTSKVSCAVFRQRECRYLLSIHDSQQ